MVSHEKIFIATDSIYVCLHFYKQFFRGAHVHLRLDLYCSVQSYFSRYLSMIRTSGVTFCKTLCNHCHSKALCMWETSCNFCSGNVFVKLARWLCNNAEWNFSVGSLFTWIMLEKSLLVVTQPYRSLSCIMQLILVLSSTVRFTWQQVWWGFSEIGDIHRFLLSYYHCNLHSLIRFCSY